jgi:hypothetical protein
MSDDDDEQQKKKKAKEDWLALVAVISIALPPQPAPPKQLNIWHCHHNRMLCHPNVPHYDDCPDPKDTPRCIMPNLKSIMTSNIQAQSKGSTQKWVTNGKRICSWQIIEPCSKIKQTAS